MDELESLKGFIRDGISWLSIPKIQITDIIEIIILAFLIYTLVKWIKTTRAWSLVKGLAVIMGFWIVAIIFELGAVQWIITNTISVGIIAVIVLFQPEFRKALEQLGQRNIVKSFLVFDESKEGNEKFSDSTRDHIVRAIFTMAKVKTGGLIVMEADISLNDYIDTGIYMDSLVSSQILISIFEPNTPLHDGAVIIRGDRIIAGTCYLPLSDNTQLSKDLGTRHRAGIGISEITDSLTIIVSEESGKVSIATDGKLIRNIDHDYLSTKLKEFQKKNIEVTKIRFWKGRGGNERKTD